MKSYWFKSSSSGTTVDVGVSARGEFAAKVKEATGGKIVVRVA